MRNLQECENTAFPTSFFLIIHIYNYYLSSFSLANVFIRKKYKLDAN
jgi:hypothetical protein